MAYNDFIKFATNHRILLETAIKKYPTALKPSDLVEFDQIMLETKKELRSHGLLETWKPIATFKSPEDFLYVRENELILEAIDKKIIDDLKINPATRTQITAVENLRTWFDKLSPDVKIQVDKFAQTWSPSKNKFEPELDAIEEVINSMYGHGKEGGTVKKLAKNFGGWLTRGMSKLTGAGKVSDAGADLNEQAAIQEMIARLPSASHPLENLMLVELFAPQMVNEGPLSPGLLTAPNVSAFVPHAHHGLSHAALLAKKAALLKAQAASAAAVAAKTGAVTGAAAVAPAVPGAGGAVSMAALKAGGGKGAAASMYALKGAGAKAAVAGGVSSVGAGLMIGGVLLAGAAVYAGWSARDSRKRIESLMAIARQMKTIGTPPPLPLPPPPDPALPDPPDPADPRDRPPPPPPRGDIYVFRGKGNKGFQSRAANLLNGLGLDPVAYKAAQRASSAVLNALGKDLKAAGFNVLEEGKRKRKRGIDLTGTQAALNSLPPKVAAIFRRLLGDLAKQHRFNIRGGLAGGTDVESPPEKTPLTVEQKSTIKKYYPSIADSSDFGTVESIKKAVRYMPPATDEGKEAFKKLGLMESYSYLHSNNLISNKQFYSRDLRMNKGLIRESIMIRK